MAQLTLVSVPIGNLGDITKRCLEKLSEGKIILAEDTRRLKTLLQELGVDYSDKEIIAYHDHSSDNQTNSLIERLNNNEDLILVSDAGSPIISDPGHKIVGEVLHSGHEVKTAPGVSSVIAALEVSGLAPIPFHFHGFYPRDNSKKNVLIEEINSSKGTHIFFESPKRAISTLEQLTSEFADFDFSVARELTKTFETVYRFKGRDFKGQEIIEKGEFVILLHNTLSLKNSSSKAKNLCLEYLDGKSNPKQLSKILAEILNENPKEIYNKLNRKD